MRDKTVAARFSARYIICSVSYILLGLPNLLPRKKVENLKQLPPAVTILSSED